MKRPRSKARIHARHHAVQFYGNEASLFNTVAGFLSDGLIAGQPAIVIATKSHAAGILEQLQARLIDVALAKRTGDLLVLDAHETLSAFMDADGPDPDLFENHVGGLIDRIVDGRPRIVVRAYGEMVDLLWKEGRSAAAIRLEMLWNKLVARRGFALLCGYAMGNFYKQAQQFHQVCEQHTHVNQPEPNVVVLEPKRRARSA